MAAAKLLHYCLLVSIATRQAVGLPSVGGILGRAFGANASNGSNVTNGANATNGTNGSTGTNATNATNATTGAANTSNSKTVAKKPSKTAPTCTASNILCPLGGGWARSPNYNLIRCPKSGCKTSDCCVCPTTTPVLTTTPIPTCVNSGVVCNPALFWVNKPNYATITCKGVCRTADCCSCPTSTPAPGSNTPCPTSTVVTTTPVPAVVTCASSNFQCPLGLGWAPTFGNSFGLTKCPLGMCTKEVCCVCKTTTPSPTTTPTSTLPTTTLAGTTPTTTLVKTTTPCRTTTAVPTCLSTGFMCTYASGWTPRPNFQIISCKSGQCTNKACCLMATTTPCPTTTLFQTTGGPCSTVAPLNGRPVANSTTRSPAKPGTTIVQNQSSKQAGNKSSNSSNSTNSSKLLLYSASDGHAVQESLGAGVEQAPRLGLQAPGLALLSLGMAALLSIGGVAYSLFMTSKERENERRPRYIEVEAGVASDEEPLMADIEGALE